VLEGIAAEAGGDVAVAAAAPWASLTRMIATGTSAATADLPVPVPAIALRLAHMLATDGPRCRGLVDAGVVAAVLLARVRVLTLTPIRTRT